MLHLTNHMITETYLSLLWMYTEVKGICYWICRTSHDLSRWGEGELGQPLGSKGGCTQFLYTCYMFLSTPLLKDGVRDQNLHSLLQSEPNISRSNPHIQNEHSLRMCHLIKWLMSCLMIGTQCGQ